jgi:hypothetical protein
MPRREPGVRRGPARRVLRTNGRIPVRSLIIGLGIIAVMWPILEACRQLLGSDGPAILAVLVFVGVIIWAIV